LRRSLERFSAAAETRRNDSIVERAHPDGRKGMRREFVPGIARALTERSASRFARGGEHEQLRAGQDSSEGFEFDRHEILPVHHSRNLFQTDGTSCAHCTTRRSLG
jgi:hypothetical protein